MRFGRKEREDKLYQEWPRYSELLPEDNPKKETPRDISVRKKRANTAPPVLHILLGVGIAMLCLGLSPSLYSLLLTITPNNRVNE